MTALRKVSRCLAQAEEDRLYFACPGCGIAHGISYGDGPGQRWSWNGNSEAPTFTRSILFRCRWADEYLVCHSIVTGGQIQFLEDCTHHLAGQTVDLPDWEDE